MDIAFVEAQRAEADLEEGEAGVLRHQVAVGHRHALQIGLFVGLAGQVQQIGQRKVAHLTKAQDLASDGVEPAQTIQAAGFVASHPQPIASEGRA